MTMNWDDQYIDGRGYYRYCFSHRLVHRAIAQHTLGKDTRGKVVHHKDHNKLNNQPENLEVMTKETHNLLHLDDDESDEDRGGQCALCGDPVLEDHHKYCSNCYFELVNRDEYL